MGRMEIPTWPEVRDRSLHWVAFVGPRRLIFSAFSMLAVLTAGWLLVRPSGPPIESVVPRASGVGVMVNSSTVAPMPLTLKVHVTGAVLQPGVYQLSSTARVVDAVMAAGGAAKSADLERINLAQTLIDTEQVFVPTRTARKSPITVAPRLKPSRTTVVPPTVPGALPPIDPRISTTVVPALSGGSATASSKININTASADQLDALPGVGPSTAKAIISYRTQKGLFKKISDLMNVPGIGPAKFDAMRSQVAV